MGNVFSQSFFMAKPALTEKNCPDQTGRVFIVTGGYTGVGYELCNILYAHNATVWIAGRSESKANDAMSRIGGNDRERLHFLSLDLSDLSTIKPAVNLFLSHEQRLDVLVNNAGVMFPPAGSTDHHGNELQLGTNCLGHYLLYQLLEPLLTKTAASSPTGTVRVAWAGSIGVQLACPQPSGIVLDGQGNPTDQGVMMNYGQTKVGNVFFAREFAKATPQTGIVHVAFNPGNLRTELQRHWKSWDAWFLDAFGLYPPIFGAYTELWSALAPDLTPDKSGAYVFPWGRLGSLPQGIERSMQEYNGEPGTGVADKFISWCEKRTEAFS